MGLIKAGFGSIGGTLADQWKEFFYCDSLSANVLVTKGQKRTSARSSNTKGEDNIISNGSGIAVADGQCMMIVEQGKVIEVCAEPGEYTFDSSSEPSIFTGGLGKGILDTFKTIGKRFTYGADTGKDQRVYYFNTKEIIDNRFGTATPVPFRVVDRNIGLDLDVSIRCNGLFSYRISNPLLFYTNVCGNVERAYQRAEIDSQLRSEFMSALQPSFSKISALQVRPNEIPAYTVQLCEAMNEVLTQKWSELRGITVVSVSINSITLPDEDADLIRQAQHAAIMRDPTMAAATLTEAQATAMKTAAGNSAGAMTGFMGMGMVQNAGSASLAHLYQMGNTSKRDEPQGAAPDSWKCSCGAENHSKFCAECGKEKPVARGWVCDCGATNFAKFCPECGAPRPAAQFCCDKCGWKPEAGQACPKFCPECGDPFNENDRI